MTLDGTNSWVVTDPDSGRVVIVDPGPRAPAHLDALAEAAPGGVEAILLTHRHPDHSEGAAALARRLGCGVRAADPAFGIGADGLVDGDLLDLGAVQLEVLATPGHTDDSCSLLLSGPDGVRLLTGDTVLGRGTTVIAEPDGDLGAYLVSLARLERIVVERDVVELLPGHGPVVTKPASWLASYREHRAQRLAEVEAALQSGATTPDEIVARVYAEVATELRPAARQSVVAQLAHLRSRKAPQELQDDRTGCTQQDRAPS